MLLFSSRSRSWMTFFWLEWRAPPTDLFSLFLLECSNIWGSPGHSADECNRSFFWLRVRANSRTWTANVLPFNRKKIRDELHSFFLFHKGSVGWHLATLPASPIDIGQLGCVSWRLAIGYMSCWSWSIWNSITLCWDFTSSNENLTRKIRWWEVRLG